MTDLKLLRHIILFILATSEIWQTVASPVVSNKDGVFVNKIAPEQTHGIVTKRDISSKPDFHSKTIDPNLLTKLAKAHLGPGASLRFRRDEYENAVDRDLETTQVETAEAAIEAEEAKDSSIEALLASSKLEHDLKKSGSEKERGHKQNEDKKSSPKTSSESSPSKSSPKSKSPEHGEANRNTEIVEIDETYDDDDEDEDENGNNHDDDDSEEDDDDEEDEREDEDSEEEEDDDENEESRSDNSHEDEEEEDDQSHKQAHSRTHDTDEEDDNDSMAHETIVEDDVVTVKSIEFDSKGTNSRNEKNKVQHKSNGGGKGDHKELDDDKGSHQQDGKGKQGDKGKHDKKGEDKSKTKDGGERRIKEEGGQKIKHYESVEHKDVHKEDHGDKRKHKEYGATKAKHNRNGGHEGKPKKGGGKGKEDEEHEYEPPSKNRAKKLHSDEDSSVCRGLLDFKRMSDDFRKRLQTLIEREEDVVDRLEHLESAMKEDVPREKKGRGSSHHKSKGKGKRSEGSDLEPIKACVYINENPGRKSERRHPKLSSRHKVGTSKHEYAGNSDGGHRQHDTSRANATDEERSRIHVYTPEGELPNSHAEDEDSDDTYPHEHSSQEHSSQEHSSQEHSSEGHSSEGHSSDEQQHGPGFDQGLPILEARYVASENDFSQRQNLARTQKKVIRETEEDYSNSKASGEIDLENIYWVKPSDYKSSSDSAGVNVLSEIYKNGQDVLIIPISSKFRNIRDVANSFVDSVRGGTDRVKGKVNGAHNKLRGWWYKVRHGKNKPEERNEIPTDFRVEDAEKAMEKRDRKFKMTIRRV